MNKGKIIFLNGVSSAGKTTLAKSLQKKLEAPYFWLSIDTFCDMNPSKLWETEPVKAVLQAYTMLSHVIKLYSDEGYNVIADNVLQRVQQYNPLVDYVNLLHDYPVLFVHVTCLLEELRRREKERGDRKTGQAEQQLQLLEPQDTYDLTVDTYYNTTDECADMIIQNLSNCDNISAFEILFKRIGLNK
jgi:chloramphenicol 3-O-phosphotransferase